MSDETIGLYCDRKKNGWHDKRGEWFAASLKYIPPGTDGNRYFTWTLESHYRTKLQFPDLIENPGLADTPAGKEKQPIGFQPAHPYFDFDGTITDLACEYEEWGERGIRLPVTKLYFPHPDFPIDPAPTYPPTEAEKLAVPNLMRKRLIGQRLSRGQNSYQDICPEFDAIIVPFLSPWASIVLLMNDSASLGTYTAEIPDLKVRFRCKCGRKFAPLPATLLVDVAEKCAANNISRVSLDTLTRLNRL